MADDHQQPGAVGSPGRGERAGATQDRGTQPGARPAQETQGDAVTAVVEASVDATMAKEIRAEPETEAAPVIFTPAPPDLSLLDPRRNGVLEALERIERNTADGGRPGRRQAAATAEPSQASALPLRDSRGRFMSRDSASQGQGQLRQRIARVRRVERSVERSMPGSSSARTTDTGTPAERQGDGQASRGAGTEAVADTTAPGTASRGGKRQAGTPEETPPAKRRAQAAEAAKVAAREVRQADGSASEPADTSASDTTGVNKAADKDDDAPADLTPAQLRALPLRGDNGQFLSRDEKEGMSPAQLAQARARQERQSEEDNRSRGVLSESLRFAGDTLKGKEGDAADAAGTAAGSAYYGAAKELYQAADSLVGEDSRGRALATWAKAQWDKRRGDDDGDGDDDDTADTTPAADAGDDHQRRTTKALKDAHATAEQQAVRTEEYREQRTEIEEDRHRVRTSDTEDRHREREESFEELTEANREGFEEVVEAIEKMPPPDGGDSTIIPTGFRGGFRGGGGRGGPKTRGRFGRAWDRFKTKLPGGGARAGAGAAGAAGAAGTTAARGAGAADDVAKGASNTAKATRVSSQAIGAADDVAKGAGTAAKGAAAASTTAKVSSQAVGAADDVAKGASLTSKALGAAGKVARGGSRLLGWAAAPLTGYLAYQDTQAELAERDDLTADQKQAIATGSGVGAGGGALAGAGAGAAAGAAIGSVVPGVGTAIGGVLGTVIGGALGAWGGEEAGKNVGEAVADTMDSVEEQAEKTIKEREKERKEKESKWWNPVSWFSGDSEGAGREGARTASYSGPGGAYREAQAAQGGSASSSEGAGGSSSSGSGSGSGYSGSLGGGDPEQALIGAMAEAGITDPNEQAAFMGQMHHESRGFTASEESFNYSTADRIMSVSKTARDQGRAAVEQARAQGPEAVAELMYGGRMGNIDPGDGYKYRGRGFTQLTGRDNYTSASEALGVDLVNNPDLAADPEVSARVSAWYWKNRSGLSEAAKRGDTERVTELLNGGHNGLADRRNQTQRYLAAARAGDLMPSSEPSSELPSAGPLDSEAVALSEASSGGNEAVAGVTEGDEVSPSSTLPGGGEPPAMMAASSLVDSTSIAESVSEGWSLPGGIGAGQTGLDAPAAIEALAGQAGLDTPAAIEALAGQAGLDTPAAIEALAGLPGGLSKTEASATTTAALAADKDRSPGDIPVASASETRVPEQPAEAVNARRAAEAMHPAPRAPQQPPALIASRQSQPGIPGEGGLDGKDGGSGRDGRGSGLNDVAMEFDDTTLTLMAYDRI